MTSSKFRNGRYLVTHDSLWEKVSKIDGEFTSSDVMLLFENANPNAVSGGLTHLVRKKKLICSRTEVHKSNRHVVYYTVNPDYDEEDDDGHSSVGIGNGDKIFAKLMGSRRYQDFIPARHASKESKSSSA